MADNKPSNFQVPSMADRALMIAARNKRIVQDKLLRVAELAGRSKEK